MKFLMSLLCLLGFLNLNGQLIFSELANMPERVSNNAVTAAAANGEMYVYSFSGIDSTKSFSGIHKKAWRYSVSNDVWEAIDPLPSGNGRIAAGASTVKNKIYIIGGYEVFSNGNESSFDEVHVFDPETNTYLPDAAPCLIPIDDHVQAVWKDSLIFVVTGWSNNGNVAVVQIFNPTENTWGFGTSVPSSTDYRVFGATGTIIGDTLYYAGGASDACCNPAFPPTSFFRKGYINPEDPTDITWSGYDAEDAKIYRGIVLHNTDGQPTWVFGSDITYNYDGIDYNGSGGVEPSNDFVTYDLFDTWELVGDVFENPLSVMDLRGYGVVENAELSGIIIAGGMEPGQVVSNKTYYVQLGLIWGTNDYSQLEVSCFPNPAQGKIQFSPKGNYEIELTKLNGQRVLHRVLSYGESLSLRSLTSGIYFLKIQDSSGKSKIEKIIIP